ncbi:MAG: hypothetical protein KatS3mg082_2790 [Nitrospiraceae bacterium]|nr:MAG: hypothetical protein KatS3mg082_2790 [Nitrospiraceae bacterium]
MVRPHLVECGHHFLEGPLVVGDLAGVREGVAHAHLGERFLQRTGHDVPQRHGGGTDLRADHLESAGNPLRGLSHLCVSQIGPQVRALADRRNHRHQMRLAGAVVAHDQQPSVVGGMVELKLGDDEGGQPLGHLVGDDVGADQLPGTRGLTGVPQLDHGLDGLELDQLSIFHCAGPLEIPLPVPLMSSPPDWPPEHHRSGSGGIRGGPEWHR